MVKFVSHIKPLHSNIERQIILYEKESYWYILEHFILNRQIEIIAMLDYRKLPDIVNGFSYYQIDQIGVATEYRKQGYAKNMIDKLVRIAEEDDNVTKIIAYPMTIDCPWESGLNEKIWELSSHDDLIRFYTRCGFVKEDRKDTRFEWYIKTI